MLLLEALPAQLAHDGRRRVRVESEHVDPQLGLVGDWLLTDRVRIVSLDLGPLSPTAVVLHNGNGPMQVFVQVPALASPQTLLFDPVLPLHHPRE